MCLNNTLTSASSSRALTAYSQPYVPCEPLEKQDYRHSESSEITRVPSTRIS